MAVGRAGAGKRRNYVIMKKENLAAKSSQEMLEDIYDILLDYDGYDPNSANQLRALIDDIVDYIEKWKSAQIEV